eukprot:TRINITY_DN1524_c0_g1_i3.p1 TRINITY_DN1524_c0_g1~~TRINITY_DN1524_c0_g1_i3.p1  ORF type:complete len:742 (+),score=151.70 TRINITY_DN1524_c0_g1_i3:89-2227(+)
MAKSVLSCAPCQWLLERSLREGEPPDERARKETVVPLLTLCTPTSLVSFFLWTLSPPGTAASTYPASVGAIIFVELTVFGAILVTRRLPLLMVEISMLCFTGCLMILDWGQAAELSQRLWFPVILTFDLMLTLNGRQWAQRIQVHMCAMFSFLYSMEDGVRLGLYDIEGWSTVDRSEVMKHTECADPPCAVGVTNGLLRWMMIALVLYVDFFATRGFAEGQRREKEAMRASVHVAEQVSVALVRFDLETAAGALAAEEAGLPEALLASLQNLVSNLASYRPYLPQSVLEGRSEDPDDAAGTDSNGSSDGPFSGMCDPLGSGHGMRDPLSSGHGMLDPLSSGHCSQHGRSRRESSSGDSSMGSGSTGAQNYGTKRKSSVSLAHRVQQRRVVLLVRNSRNMLPACQQYAPTHLYAWMTEQVEDFLTAVRDQKGLVDLISGDHHYASFGAIKQLGGARMKAAHCAAALCFTDTDPASRGPSTTASGAESATLDELETTSAVCSGLGLCGDFGCPSMQRFMVIGPVRSVLNVQERMAAGWGVGVLMDDAVRADATTFWQCRLRKRVVWQKYGATTATGLWELLAARQSGGGDDGPQEWMYELDDSDLWGPYNAAVSAWCLGKTDEALGIASKAAAECCPSQLSVHDAEATPAVGGKSGAALECPLADALRVLQSAIASGQDPPLLCYTATSSAGLPSPVCDSESDTGSPQCPDPLR